MSRGTRPLGIALLLLAVSGCTTVRLGVPVGGDLILVPVRHRNGSAALRERLHPSTVLLEDKEGETVDVQR